MLGDPDPSRCTAVMRPSRAGKPTLLLRASELDRPTSGLVRLAGVESASLGENELSGGQRQVSADSGRPRQA